MPQVFAACVLALENLAVFYFFSRSASVERQQRRDLLAEAALRVSMLAGTLATEAYGASRASEGNSLDSAILRAAGDVTRVHRTVREPLISRSWKDVPAAILAERIVRERAEAWSEDLVHLRGWSAFPTTDMRLGHAHRVRPRGL